jgi:disulfide bond formation protein DsbB
MFQTFNTLVGAGVIGLMLIIGILWILLLTQTTHHKLFQWFHRHGIILAGILALGAMAGSLIYSDFFKLAPCFFCWWQRIFMYPQVIILGVSAWYRDAKIWLSGFILSAIGACFSIYHILLQSNVLNASSAPCAADAVSCARIDVLIFNWITIPIMCLTVFVGIMTLLWISHQKNKVQK